MARILAITSFKICPPQNGGEKALCDFFHHTALYHDLYVAGTQDNQNLPSRYTFDIIAVFKSAAWMRYGNIFYFFNLLRIAREKKIDTIIFELPYLPFIFLLFRFFTPYQCVYHSHNIEYQRFQSYQKKVWLLLYVFEWLFYTFSHAILSISNDDIQTAQRIFGTPKNKFFYLPHGVPFDVPPLDKAICQDKLRLQYNISINETLLFFNGDLGYLPNQSALQFIVHDILPRLDHIGLAYRLIICGKNLSPDFNNFRGFKKIIYAAYVDDIAFYNKGIDIFINPVIQGGGVKIKLLEALAFDANCVSTESGAKGILTDRCGQKLHIVQDYDWDAFAQAIQSLAERTELYHTPPEYYETYSWKHIVKKLVF